MKYEMARVRLDSSFLLTRKFINAELSTLKTFPESFDEAQYERRGLIS
jgi:hypothetical protein